MFRSTHRATTTVRTNLSARLGVETLEERQMLAASILDSSEVNFGTFLGGRDLVGNTTATATAIAVNPMSIKSITNHSWDVKADDVYKITLKKDQLVHLRETTFAYNNANGGDRADIGARLSLLNSAGRTLVEKTGVASQEFSYAIPKDDTYFIRLSAVNPGNHKGYFGNVVLRTLGLNNTQFDTRKLNPTSEPDNGMFAFLAGKTLTIASSAGRGFSFEGNWTKASTAQKTTTYSATGVVKLKSALGDIPLTFTSLAPLKINTKNDEFGGLFGDVNNASVRVPLSPFAANFGKTDPNKAFGLEFGGSLAQLEFGIKLGKDLGDKGANTGAPVFSNVPYLYATAGNDLSAKFGGITVSAPNSTTKLSVVADPSDPYLFVGLQGINGPVTDVGIAGSKNGLIPFVPPEGAVPKNYTGTLTGHLFMKGGLDLGDAKIPLGLAGSFVLNLDPARTGKFLGGAFSTASDFVKSVKKDHGTLAQEVLVRLDKALKNVAFGVVGTADLSFARFGLGVSLPLMRSTGIYEGHLQRFNTKAALATDQIFKGTPLAEVIKMPSASIDGFLNLATKEYELNLDGGFTMPVASGSGKLTLTNKGMSGTANLQSPIGKLDIDVRADYSGNLDLKGKGNIAIGPFSAQADVKVLNSPAAGFSIDITAEAGLNLLVANPKVKGTFKMDRNGTFGTLTAPGVNLLVSAFPNGGFIIVGSAGFDIGVFKFNSNVNFSRTGTGAFSYLMMMSTSYNLGIASGDVFMHLNLGSTASGRPSSLTGFSNITVNAFGQKLADAFGTLQGRTFSYQFNVFGIPQSLVITV